MSDRRMTTRTLEAAGLAMHRVAIDGVGNGGVATAASGLGNFQIEGGDADVIRVPASGEIEGMKEPVAGFNGIFPGEIVRRVAVIASGSGVVAGLDPSVVLSAHRVAIGAGCGIVQKVRITSGVQEGVSSETYQSPGKYSRHQKHNPGKLHAKIIAKQF